MKKSFKIMGMAAMVLLLAVSCKKENKDENNGEAKFMTFTAGISQGNGKTYLNGSNLLWSTGDAIKVNGDEFTLTEGGGTNKGEFSGTTEEKGTYYAVYPASGTLSENVATITLPAEQPYVDGSFAMGVAPMVAMTDDSKSFTFTNVCGLLRLDFTNITKQFDKIVLESANGEYLAGEGTVEITGGGNESLVLTDASSNSKSITMSTSDVTDYSKIVFVLPAGTLKHGFNVYFYDGGVQFDAVSTSADMEIAAGTMNVVTVNHEVKEQAATIQQDAVTTTSLTIPYEIKEECESASIQCATDENFENVVGTKVIVGGTKASPWKEGSVEFDGLTPATLYHVRILVKSANDSAEIPYCTIVAETLGGEVPTIPSGALPGVFTVGPGIDGTYGTSDDDKVWFSKGNLWYNTTEDKFYFEAEQWNYPNEWNAEHIGHFYWSKNKSIAISKAYTEASQYCLSDDVFFTNVDPDFEVNGKKNWRTLTHAEMTNLRNNRPDNSLKKYMTLNDGTIGYVFLPDGSDAGNFDNIKSLDDLDDYNALFLPSAGQRTSYSGESGEPMNWQGVGSQGWYWTNTLFPPNQSGYVDAYIFRWTGSYSFQIGATNNGRNNGNAVRLVYDIPKSK